ncbi:hypothetical protein CRI85_02665 [Leuconostoc pseudomesenteroides]|uniref:hypothetical protein n=1 Tax=Leuconostoc pseudomesenteroides TaxID=33968 RepID=UPI001E4AE481|nr:hypothetical protein [Leuconostoc pseudomesenteroides]MCC8439250.1 hypothetical protein [Leuconostoc pseudomesenteroides]
MSEGNNTSEEIVYSDVIMTEYFMYDPKTLLFTGNVLTVSQPNNATTVPATGFFNTPKWDSDSEKWFDPTTTSRDEQIANLTQQLANSQLLQAKTNAQLIKQNAALVKQVNDLQAKKETTNG